MSKVLNMVFPEYLKEFVCIGSGCSDTCCAGWSVDVDKNTFNLYKSFRSDDTELMDLLAKKVTRIRNKKSTVQYAKIKMDQRKSCPFLDENRLCKIHGTMGEEALSGVCTNYPRKYVKINGTTEFSATLSCPEVARLALLRPEGLPFVSEPMKMSDSAGFAVESNFDIREKYAHVVKYFFDIQINAITILQYRALSLEKRLMLLGVFSNKLYKLFAENEGDIEKIIMDFGDSDYYNDYANGLSQIGSNYEYQIELVDQWFEKSMRCMNAAISPKFTEYMNKSAQGILKQGKTKQEMLAAYINDGIPKYNQHAEKITYILENYLVNTLFEDHFPISKKSQDASQNDIFYSYMHLIIKFIILRTTIIGLLMNEVELTDDVMVEMIQCFAKKIHHNGFLINDIIKKARENEDYSLASAIVMLNII